MVNRNLVFAFHVFDGFEDNEAIRVHLSCLKKYSHIFDTAKFVITIDDVSDYGMIKKAESMIIDCGFRDIEFKVAQNDCYREAGVFKREIIDRIDSFDGITFFGHTKGVTNVVNPSMDKNEILKWIAAMYYLNLNFVDEAERVLISEFEYSMFGAYKVVSDKIENRNGRWYAGTFYWMNTNRLSNNMRQRGMEFPNLHDRGYAEFITGEVDMLGSHGNVSLYPFDYNDAGKLVDFLLLGDTEEIRKYDEYEKALGI